MAFVETHNAMTKGPKVTLQQPAYSLDALRSQFPVTRELTYLNHASISPLPAPVHDMVHEANERLARNPASLFGGKAGDPLGNLFVDFSVVVAGLINAAEPHEVVGVASTSAGLNAVAGAVAWEPGDNLVLSAVEFPSNVYPWMLLEQRGVEVRLVPTESGGGLTLAALEPLVDARTRLVTVSAVQFLSGRRADLAALGAYCRARGILFVVDAIQAIGHVPIDVQAMHIDVLATGGQKSLLALPGQGFLYVREAVAEAMQPTILGANAVEGWEHWLHYDMTPRRGALRFMMGTPDILGMAAVVAAVRFLREVGVAHIDAWTQHLSAVAMDDLSARGYAVITPREPGQYGPIVTFRAPGVADLTVAEAQADAWMRQLREQGVVLTKHWDAARVPYLRISTHCYNTVDEVLRVGAILGDYPS